MTVSCFTPPLGHTNLLCVEIDDSGSISTIINHFSSEVHAARISEAISVALYFLAAISCGAACVRVSWTSAATVIQGRDLTAVSRDGNPIRYLKFITISLFGHCLTAAVLGCTDLSRPQFAMSEARATHIRGLAIATVVPTGFHLLSIFLFHTLVLLSASQTACDGTSGTFPKSFLALSPIILLSELIMPFILTSSDSQGLFRGLIMVQIISYCALLLVCALPVLLRIIKNRKRREACPGFTTISFLVVAFFGILQALLATGILSNSVRAVSAASIFGALGAFSFSAWSVTIVCHYHHRELPAEGTYRDSPVSPPDSNSPSQRELQLLPTFGGSKRRLSRPLSSRLSMLASKTILRPRDRSSQTRPGESKNPQSPNSARRTQKDILLSPFSTPSSSPSPLPTSPESLASSRTPFPSRKSFPFSYIRSSQVSPSSSKRVPSVNKTPSPGQQWDARSPGQKERSRIAASYAGQTLAFEMNRSPGNGSPESLWRTHPHILRPGTSLTVDSMLSNPRPERALTFGGLQDPFQQARRVQRPSTAGAAGLENSSRPLHTTCTDRLHSASPSLWLSFPPSSWLPTPPSSAHGTFGHKERTSGITLCQNSSSGQQQPPQLLAEGGLGSPFQHQSPSGGRPEAQNLSVEELVSASGLTSQSRSRATSNASMPSEIARLASGRMHSVYEEMGTTERPMSSSHAIHEDVGAGDAQSHLSQMSASHPDAVPARRSSCAFGDGSERALEFLASLDQQPMPRSHHIPHPSGTHARSIGLPEEGGTEPSNHSGANADLHSGSEPQLRRACSIEMYRASIRAAHLDLIRQALKSTGDLIEHSEPWIATSHAGNTTTTTTNRIRRKPIPSDSETLERNLQSSSRRTSTFGFQPNDNEPRTSLRRSVSLSSHYSRQSSAAQSSWHGMMTQGQDDNEDSAGRFVRESWGLRSVAPGEEDRDFFLNGGVAPTEELD
ncbi:hypothetical protein A4X09_0g2094 [Tilletia walkeri]|uniref:Uncharacterized protein n=1 Tax=Tilletia walkeri TaxID=117179 RepID=A0A8X7NDG0_9BASI|nr:hypothetical protein A4X09_0g2094 [Tilletia walkeri]